MILGTIAPTSLHVAQILHTIRHSLNAGTYCHTRRHGGARLPPPCATQPGVTAAPVGVSGPDLVFCRGSRVVSSLATSIPAGPGRRSRYSDYTLCVDMTGTAVQRPTPTESYGNFGLGVRLLIARGGYLGFPALLGCYELS
jgi:hypothetical protein